MKSLRVFFVGGALSYRALFNWARPAIYIPTMLGSPLFQILFFTYLGRYSRVEDDAFFVVGNAVQACSMACIYGMTMAIANDRQFGTLMPLLASPANRAAMFLGRGLPLMANGFLVSAFGLAVGALLTDFSFADTSFASLAAVLAVTVFSCAGLGLLLGSFGVRARDVFFISNLCYFLMLLVCGVNIPIDALPGWLQAISNSVPVTHGIAAAREAAAGASIGDVGELVAIEALIGSIYGAVAFGMLRYLEFEAKRRATLEAY